MTKLRPTKGEIELTPTPPFVKLRLTWEKEEGRRLTEIEFKNRLEVYLRQQKQPRPKKIETRTPLSKVRNR